MNSTLKTYLDNAARMQTDPVVWRLLSEGNTSSPTKTIEQALDSGSSF